MGKIRILHIIAGFIGGGVEEFLYNNIINMPKEDYDISVITYDKLIKSCIDKFKKLDIKIFELNNSNVKDIKNCKAIYNIIKENKFDIVHIHLTEFSMYPCFIARLLNTKIIIAHSHNIYVDSREIERLKFLVHKRITNLLANRYMACSRGAAISLFGKKNVQKNKVKLINNGINIERFKFNEDMRKSVRKQLQIEQDEIVIGNIGRFTEQKNHRFILDVFEKISKVKNNYKLLLIGEGVLKEDIKEYALKLGLKDKVIFKDNTDRIEEIYNAIDYFLFPSKYEGLGMVVIEAQVNGLKVLASYAIPQEAKITNNMKFLSLKTSPEEWAKLIIQESFYERKKIAETAEILKFDSRNTAMELDKYYKSEVCKIK